MKTVLIIDDEQEMIQFLGRTIERKGYKALTAATGEEAIKLYGENRPDCVLLDLHLSMGIDLPIPFKGGVLSGMEGIDVLAKIKEIDSGVKVYFVTGDQLFVERQSAESIGAAGYLIKPVDVGDVIKILESL